MAWQGLLLLECKWLGRKAFVLFAQREREATSDISYLTLLSYLHLL
jgi:hypothetical protein